MANIITSVDTTQNCKSKNNECCLKVFRYSFSGTIPMFFNRLKSDLSLSNRYKRFTSDSLGIEFCQNAVLNKIDITMTTINRKL